MTGCSTGKLGIGDWGSEEEGDDEEREDDDPRQSAVHVLLPDPPNSSAISFPIGRYTGFSLVRSIRKSRENVTPSVDCSLHEVLTSRCLSSPQNVG